MDEKLEGLKTEFIRINLEIDDIQAQIRSLHSSLRKLEVDRACIKDAMLDICGKTGLTVYERRKEDE